jgi:hypothetical protein
MPANKPDPLLEASRIGAIITPAGTPELPHERDESIAAPVAPQTVMVQAQRDIARGLEDTDCYTRLGKLNTRAGKR